MPELPEQKAEMENANDPLEPFNRRVFDNTYFLDRLLVRPLAELYRAIIPPGIRERITAITANMDEPVIFANDVLQGDFDRAGTTLARFGINTTAGVGGMWDFAGDWGLDKQSGDFGQTLASWGVGEGPYLMLPGFGPSDLRDAFGRGVDYALMPWQYIAWAEGGTSALIDYEATYIGADAIVRREKHIESFDALRDGAVDPYAKVRSAYRQFRHAQIGDGAAGNGTQILRDK